MSQLSENLANIRLRIKTAAERAGRSASEVKLVAVSKTHPAEAIRDAAGAGVTAFGENKVQEAESKITELGRAFAEWHLIGHLQSNKARKAVQLFDVIHTVDSLELAERLERLCTEEARARLPVLIQVDLAGEATKSGIAESELHALIDFLVRCAHLRLTGLMVLPPYFDDPESARPFFRRLRQIRDRLAENDAFGGERGELSMGMSHDLEAAIEEGSTIVRVGTAIFGSRGTNKQ